MNIYLNKNVYEAAKERIRFVYEEFKNVIVNFSGGKDSTVVLHLALEVAEEIGRLPVNVFFFDQECEWEHNIEYIRHVMHRPDVNPIWYQVPFKIDNATNSVDKWMHCWEEGKEWLRPKEPDSIHSYENTLGREPDFYELMDLLPSQYFHGEKVAALCGMRCEETPKRKIAITETPPFYKWVIWGAARKYNKFDFDPIYDWEYSDVWKYIQDNHFEYCPIYDFMWQKGVPINKMRISSLTHETAIGSLLILQEIEGDMYNKISQRIEGVNTLTHLESDSMRCPEKLPFMFHSWEEYRDYLFKHLIKGEEEKEKFLKVFNGNKAKLYRENKLLYDEFIIMCINSILLADSEHALYENFTSQIAVSEWVYWKKHGVKKYKTPNPYIEYERNRANKG